MRNMCGGLKATHVLSDDITLFGGVEEVCVLICTISLKHLKFQSNRCGANNQPEQHKNRDR